MNIDKARELHDSAFIDEPYKYDEREWQEQLEGESAALLLSAKGFLIMSEAIFDVNQKKWEVELQLAIANRDAGKTGKMIVAACHRYAQALVEDAR